MYHDDSYSAHVIRRRLSAGAVGCKKRLDSNSQGICTNGHNTICKLAGSLFGSKFIDNLGISICGFCDINVDLCVCLSCCWSKRVSFGCSPNKEKSAPKQVIKLFRFLMIFMMNCWSFINLLCQNLTNKVFIIIIIFVRKINASFYFNCNCSGTSGLLIKTYSGWLCSYYKSTIPNGGDHDLPIISYP